MPSLLCYLLVSILQNGGEAWQEVFDWRRHLGHANHIHNRLECCKDGAEHFGVLFAKVLIQDNPVEVKPRNKGQVIICSMLINIKV